MARSVFVGAAVAVGSWVLLLVLLGNVGLQQAISIGPLSSNQAVGYLVVLLWAGAVAIAAGLQRPAVAASLTVILILDAVAALCGVLVVGELEIDHFLSVMLIATAVGLQPIGFVIGALMREHIHAHRAVT